MRRGKRGYSSKPMSKQILRDSLAVRRLLEVNPSELKDDVIAINRVTKVVKGGKNLSFSALVVVGDSRGHAGFGMGKAREVPMAIKKGIEQAKKNLIKLNMKGSTIPHQVLGRYGSAQVLLKPASEGTGVIAGGPVRKVMQVAGIQKVLTKSIGTSNPPNVVKTTFPALLCLKEIAHVAEKPPQTGEENNGKPPKEKKRAGEGPQGWSAQAGGAGVERGPLLHALKFAASRGLAQEKSSRWPRHGIEARQDRRRRQQGTEVAPRLFAPPRL